MEQTRKCISIAVPTYNEAENVVPLTQAILAQFKEHLPEYDAEILFIDNASSDGTREKLRALCAEHACVKAIFNAANFGQFNSPYYGLCQTTGDCAILLCADFQDPVELIPTLVAKWEAGEQVVCAVKTKSRENFLVRAMRSCYYKLLGAMSRVRQIPHFTGFGLYDRRFIEVLRAMNDPAPYLRGIVAEYAPNAVTVPYVQPRRRAGKSSNGFSTLYDAAMLGFTTYTKLPVRAMTFFGVLFLLASLVCGAFALAQGLSGESYQLFTLLAAIGFFGAVNLLAISVVGEYLLAAAKKNSRRPLVVEECRINFEKEGQ